VRQSDAMAAHQPFSRFGSPPGFQRQLTTPPARGLRRRPDRRDFSMSPRRIGRATKTASSCPQHDANTTSSMRHSASTGRSAAYPTSRSSYSPAEPSGFPASASRSDSLPGVGRQRKCLRRGSASARDRARRRNGARHTSAAPRSSRGRWTSRLRAHHRLVDVVVHRVSHPQQRPQLRGARMLEAARSSELM